MKINECENHNPWPPITYVQSKLCKKAIPALPSNKLCLDNVTLNFDKSVLMLCICIFLSSEVNSNLWFLISFLHCIEICIGKQSILWLLWKIQGKYRNKTQFLKMYTQNKVCCYLCQGGYIFISIDFHLFLCFQNNKKVIDRFCWKFQRRCVLRLATHGYILLIQDFFFLVYVNTCIKLGWESQ